MTTGKPGGGLFSLPGDVAEVWQDGRKVAVLFRWTLTGSDGAWKANATKGMFSPQYQPMESTVRFLITSKSGRDVRIDCIGHVLGDQVADGTTRHGVVELLGTTMRLHAPAFAQR